MTGKTHMLGGVALASSATTIFGLYEPQTVPQLITWSCAYLGSAIVGAVLLDIDHGNATASNINIFTKIISIITRIIFGHRGFIHSPLMVILLSLGCHALYQKTQNALLEMMMIGLLIGCISHLLLDIITTEGIPLTFPLQWEKEGLFYKAKKYSIIGIPESGIEEALIKLALFVVIILEVHPQLVGLNIL